MVSCTGDLHKQEYSLTRASDQSRLFSNTGQSTLGKIGLGYWLLPKTRQVEQPPLFLSLVASGNDTNIDPLFWIDAADEYSPKHRSNIPQVVGGGDIGWSKKPGKQNSRQYL